MMYNYSKKAIQLQAWAGSLGSRSLRLPEFLDKRHMKVGRLVSQTHLPGDTWYSWYLFRIEAESS